LGRQPFPQQPQRDDEADEHHAQVPDRRGIDESGEHRREQGGARQREQQRPGATQDGPLRNQDERQQAGRHLHAPALFEPVAGKGEGSGKAEIDRHERRHQGA